MGGYIGATAVGLTTTAADVQGDITSTDTTPELILKNTSEEDTEGGREGKITFKGEQSGGEESTLAQIESAHDGTSDDQKGDLIFKTNDGSDGASPTERVRIDSNGSILTATLGTDNVHLGEGAGASIASGGNNNVAVGKDAGTALTTGDNNIAIGYEALKTEDAHGNNTAVGYQALKTQNAGANAANTAIGYQAGLDLTDGHSEVFVGTLAGANVTTGDANTFVGYTAGTAVTVGANNTAFGFEALATDTQGSHSTAIGRRALKAQNFTSATDTHNSGIGNNAGQSITTASSNTAVGSNALSSNQTGNSNTAVGKGAGQSTTVAAGTYVGSQAGENTNSVSNTFIGCSAGELVTSGEKNTILGRYNGNENGLDIRTSNNNIVLSDGDGNPRGYYQSANGQWIFNGTVSGTYTAQFVHDTTGSPYGLNLAFTGAAPNNTSQAFLVCQDTSTFRLEIKANGNVVNANNSYGAISDQKLKENIVDCGSQWDDIKALTVRKYSMKVDNLDAPNRLGVIAQEVEEAGMGGLVFESTDRDKDTNEELETTTKSVNYSILYMKAVKALQEAMTRIETLETQNTTQATQIADLITRVEALEGA